MYSVRTSKEGGGRIRHESQVRELTSKTAMFEVLMCTLRVRCPLHRLEGKLYWVHMYNFRLNHQVYLGPDSWSGYMSMDIMTMMKKGMRYNIYICKYRFLFYFVCDHTLTFPIHLGTLTMFLVSWENYQQGSVHSGCFVYFQPMEQKSLHLEWFS